MLEPTGAINDARRLLSRAFENHYHPGLCGLPEACAPVNNASRKIIEAYRSVHGTTAVLVCMNGGDPVVSLPDADKCFNFCADYVLPSHDNPIVSLVLAFRANPCMATADDIESRSHACGGSRLIWS